MLVRLPLVQGITNAMMSENLFKAVCGARRFPTPKPRAAMVPRRLSSSGRIRRPGVGKELFERRAGAGAGDRRHHDYLAIRFEWRFAVSAIIANLHDIIIISVVRHLRLGIQPAGAGRRAGDPGLLGERSVVIADRVRENFRKMRKASVDDVIDNAITSTISRTIITHGRRRSWCWRCCSSVVKRCITSRWR